MKHSGECVDVSSVVLEQDKPIQQVNKSTQDMIQNAEDRNTTVTEMREEDGGRLKPRFKTLSCEAVSVKPCCMTG